MMGKGITVWNLSHIDTDSIIVCLGWYFTNHMIIVPGRIQEGNSVLGIFPIAYSERRRERADLDLTRLVGVKLSIIKPRDIASAWFRKYNLVCWPHASPFFEPGRIWSATEMRHRSTERTPPHPVTPLRPGHYCHLWPVWIPPYYVEPFFPLDMDAGEVGTSSAGTRFAGHSITGQRVLPDLTGYFHTGSQSGAA